MPEITAIQEFGNQLAILFDDGTKRLAYPTSGGLWLIKSAGESSPSDWRWPVDYAPGIHVSQEFDNGVVNHTGIDLVYSGIAGKPIYAIADSTVIDSGSTSGNGNIVKLQAFDGSYYCFYHMQNPTLHSNGDILSIGDFIGSVGDTGSNVTPAGADHLHFGTSETGWSGLSAVFANMINPRTYMSSRGIPYPW